MTLSPGAKTTAQILVTFGLCLGAGAIGLPEPFREPGTATLWLPAGVALAALIVAGVRVFPAVFAAVFVILRWHGTDTLASLGVAAGSALEGLAGAWLVGLLARGLRAFEQPRHVLILAAVVGLVAAPIGATAGVAVLVARAAVPAADAGTVWVAWWLSDLGAMLVAAPVLMLWVLHPHVAIRRRTRPVRPHIRGRRAVTPPSVIETVGLLAVAAAVSPLMFAGAWHADHSVFPLLFLLFPLLTWAALRFGARETSTVLAIFAAAAVWGAAHGAGPFIIASPAPSLRLLQVFLAVTSLAALAASSVVDERNRRDSELHLLAVTDPLTGLANYRHLTSFVDREIHRAQRTRQPFAILLLDVNKLKSINDEHGHNVGSRLLVRLADGLRRSCRVTDLIARYGGDEFAIVLPGCDEEAARGHATRIEETLASEGGTPPISVSLGIALYPRDGAACDDLLDSADNELYTMKGRSKKRSAVFPG